MRIYGLFGFLEARKFRWWRIEFLRILADDLVFSSPWGPSGSTSRFLGMVTNKLFCI